MNINVRVAAAGVGEIEHMSVQLTSRIPVDESMTQTSFSVTGGDASDWLSNITNTVESFRPLVAELDKIRLRIHTLETRPSETAFECVRSLLGRLQMLELTPNAVLVSAEGGLALTFEAASKYADLECFNNGEIVGVLSDRQGTIEPFAVSDSFEGITVAIRKVRAFLAS
ncbi:MAG: hypothetical protein SGI92_21570 [Bryobacteraceae bacterium]|nr:hypothetical protein [Bryobacteraceae bacterium]